MVSDPAVEGGRILGEELEAVGERRDRGHRRAVVVDDRVDVGPRRVDGAVDDVGRLVGNVGAADDEVALGHLVKVVRAAGHEVLRAVARGDVIPDQVVELEVVREVVRRGEVAAERGLG